MGLNSFLYLKKEESRHDENELKNDFMHCCDISWLSQINPFIDEFTEPDDIILDPFCGMGTTVISAGILGRRSIGIEIEKERFLLLKEHVKKYEDKMKYQPKLICDDSLKVNLSEEIDAIITNVPYYDTCSHSLESGSFYNITEYKKYLEMIEIVIKRCVDKLKKRGTIILFCENIRKINGDLIPQAYDIYNVISKYFHIKDEHIVLYEKESYMEDDLYITNRAHEYVYIGIKKDPEVDLTDYIEIAQELCCTENCTLVGSLGLYLTYPQILDTYPQDADFFIADDINTLKKCINILWKKKYKVFSWDKEILNIEDITEELLNGRIYVRGIKNNLIVDIMYKREGITYDEMRKFQIRENNINLYSKEGYITMLEYSERKINQAQKQRLKNLNDNI